MSFDAFSDQPRITSFAALRRQVYGGKDESFDPAAQATLGSENDVRLPPRMFVDKQQMLSPRNGIVKPEKQATWTFTAAQHQHAYGSSSIDERAADFWRLLDEQEVLLQAASATTPAAAQLVALRHRDQPAPARRCYYKACPHDGDS